MFMSALSSCQSERMERSTVHRSFEPKSGYKAGNQGACEWTVHLIWVEICEMILKDRKTYQNTS